MIWSQYMNLINDLIKQTNKIDFLFPNSFDELMNNPYYDYDKFEWFLYYVFKLDGSNVQKVGKKGKGDGGADLIVSNQLKDGGMLRIGVQAKYWKYKVGTEPINQLASAKSRHNLTHLWIITTSDLTNDAKDIAESLDIKILRAEDVKKLIENVKSHYVKELNEKGESSIEFIKSKKAEPIKIVKEIKPVISEAPSEAVDAFKKFRIELSIKHKLTPLYNVFNNEVMNEIIKMNPKTIDDLLKIKGFGEFKANLFGKELLEFIAKTLSVPETTKVDGDSKVYDALILERPKIAAFNKLTEAAVYSDQTAKNLAKMKPRNKQDLTKIYGFDQKNIEIFGDYLIKFISKI